MAKRGLQRDPPFVKRLFLNLENRSFRLDRRLGVLRFPIRAGEHVEIRLPMSRYHRGFLDDDALSVGSMHLSRDKVAITFRKVAPSPPECEGILALDTNEGSLDGVLASGTKALLVQVPFHSVRELQATYFRRRRRLARKKAGDRRTRTRLLALEGVRERRRVSHQLHLASNAVVKAASATKSLIAIEDLDFSRPPRRSRRLNRRLSSWPQSELQRQIRYKAAWQGVRVVKVDPRNTSRTCPACGWVDKSRTRTRRTNGMFECSGGQCGWRFDRQFNAALNILKAASGLRNPAARASWFRPSALRHEVVSLISPPEVGGRVELNAESPTFAWETV